jgi:hypothetical protein
MNTASRFLAAASALFVFVFGASPARAEPWFGWGQTKTEDRYTSGDIDIEDLVNGTVAGRSRTEKDELRAGTWLTLGSYWRSYEGRYQDIGLFLMAGVAFDRIARASHGSSVEVIADGTSKLRPGSSATDAPPPPSSAALAAALPVPAPSRVVVTPEVARKAVTTAWRTSGLGVDDARVDSMIARARSSAALPEARIRAMRVFAEATSGGIVPIDTSTYASAGNSIVLEARLTWRLDQLLYANEETSLERLRLERQDARAKVAGKVLDALFQWQRAWLAVRTATPGTRDATDATMRLIEAEAGLDVMTGGWFGAWAARIREDGTTPGGESP